MKKVQSKKKKMKKEKNKKAQVTIFIILALIIVVSIILVVLLLREPEVETEITDIKDPQGYIEGCVKNSLEEAVQTLMKQGGYIDPLEYRLYGGEKISYLCYEEELGKECTLMESDLKLHLEEEINNYLESRL